MIARHAYRSIETGMSFLFRCCIAISCTVVSAQPTGFCTEVAGIPVNYDEAKVGTYTLPDPLVLTDVAGSFFSC
jgi:hypothetical protein